MQVYGDPVPNRLAHPGRRQGSGSLLSTRRSCLGTVVGSESAVNTRQLQVLDPDVMITQDRCEVCTVAYDEVVQAVQATCGSNVNVVPLSPNLLQDIWADIRSVARATGQLQKADAILATPFERINEIIAETIMIPYPPRVAAIEWIEPLRLAGN